MSRILSISDSSDFDEEEIVKQLETERVLNASYVNAWGDPINVPLWFVYDNGALYTAMRRDNRKTCPACSLGATRMEERKASAFLGQGEYLLGYSAVHIQGLYNVVADADECQRIRDKLLDKYSNGRERERNVLAKFFELESVVFIELRIISTRGVNYSKLPDNWERRIARQRRRHQSNPSAAEGESGRDS